MLLIIFFKYQVELHIYKVIGDFLKGKYLYSVGSI